jgi:hypothetical protein
VLEAEEFLNRVLSPERSMLRRSVHTSEIPAGYDILTGNIGEKRRVIGQR